MSNRNHYRDLEVMNAKRTVGDVLSDITAITVCAIVGTVFLGLLVLLLIDVLLSAAPELIQDWRHLKEVWSQP